MFYRYLIALGATFVFIIGFASWPYLTEKNIVAFYWKVFKDNDFVLPGADSQAKFVLPLEDDFDPCWILYRTTGKDCIGFQNSSNLVDLKKVLSRYPDRISGIIIMSSFMKSSTDEFSSLLEFLKDYKTQVFMDLTPPGSKFDFESRDELISLIGSVKFFGPSIDATIDENEDPNTFQNTSVKTVSEIYISESKYHFPKHFGYYGKTEAEHWAYHVELPEFSEEELDYIMDVEEVRYNLKDLCKNSSFMVAHIVQKETQELLFQNDKFIKMMNLNGCKPYSDAIEMGNAIDLINFDKKTNTIMVVGSFYYFIHKLRELQTPEL